MPTIDDRRYAALCRVLSATRRVAGALADHDYGALRLAETELDAAGRELADLAAKADLRHGGRKSGWRGRQRNTRTGSGGWRCGTGGTEVMDPIRDTPCHNCPFRGRLSLTEATAVLEGYPRHDPACDVLCHHEGFETDGPHARCAGFRANAERLALVG